MIETPTPLKSVRTPNQCPATEVTSNKYLPNPINWMLNCPIRAMQSAIKFDCKDAKQSLVGAILAGL